ncbi:MAG: sulfite exporter TauE/SafE family protein, partial [Burkholderiales bacterium]|nr:sulfite exporter TauE/SafE family protein [Burkholderiales bacterium]
MELLILSCASLLAGFVDSIVGGGGLVLVPAL